MKHHAFCLIALASAYLVLQLPAPAQEKKEDETLAMEKAVLALTNKERENENLPPLKMNALLSKAARAHAANMAKQGKLEHTLDGKTAGQRVTAAGYAYLTSGENIAIASSAEEALRNWMKSKGHKANILGKQYTDIGVGLAQAQGHVYYFTQVFAKPAR